MCYSEPHEIITESDNSSDTAATDEIYAEFMPPADTHPDYMSIVDPNSDVDFIVDSSSNMATADKDLVLVADDPDDPDFVVQTCNDTETSSSTTNQRSDVISTSLEIEDVENIPKTGGKAVTVFKNAPDTDDSLYDFEPILKGTGHEVVDVEMLTKRSVAKKGIKKINVKSDNTKSSPKSNFAIKRTKRETMEIWYESDTWTSGTLEDSLSPKNGKFVSFNNSKDSEGSEEMKKYFEAAERILNFPGRPYESTDQEQSKYSVSASTADSSKDHSKYTSKGDSKDREHSEKEITERSSETDVEEALMMNVKQPCNTTVGKTEEKEVNCEERKKKEADSTKGYEDQERQSHRIVDTSDSENYLDDLDEDESKTAFKQLLQNLSTQEINGQKYVKTGSSPKAESPPKSGDDSVEMSSTGKWDPLNIFALEETGLPSEESGLLPTELNEENKEIGNVETGLSPTKVNEENKESEKVEIIYDQKSENTHINLDTNTSEKPDENVNDRTVEEKNEAKDVAENATVEENDEANDVAEVPEEEINGKTASEELDITGETENDGIRNNSEEQSKDNADEAQDQKDDDDDLIVLKHEPVRFIVASSVTARLILNHQVGEALEVKQRGSVYMIIRVSFQL